MGFSTTVALSAVLWGLNGWFQSFGAPAGVVSMTAVVLQPRARPLLRHLEHGPLDRRGPDLRGGRRRRGGAFGWRYGFWAPAVVGVLVAIGSYLLIQDRPRIAGPAARRRLAQRSLAGRKAQVGVGQHLQDPARDPARSRRFGPWPCPRALIYVTRYAINSWGVLYLQEARGYSLVQAGGMLMVSTLAGHRRGHRATASSPTSCSTRAVRPPTCCSA